jgi:hypothetical protein
MISLVETEPWRGLSAEVADAIEPALPAATREILATIGREVPEYARPIEGSFGRGLRLGVDEALAQFVALIRDPDSGRERGRSVYVGLGRGELNQGRTLDSLQAAYRVGARVAWRHIAAAGRSAGLAPETLNQLAEAVFAYIDEISADSVEGYAQARSEIEGERQRRRRELVALLLREPAVDDADVRTAAAEAGWKPPASIAALACEEHELEGILRGLPDGALAAHHDAAGCVLVADPEGPGRAAAIEAATTASSAVIGPEGERSDLPRSWSLARSGMGARRAGRLGGPGLVRAEDHLPELLLADSADTVALIAARRLGALDDLTVKARARMRETTLAYVQHGGNAAEMARDMHVHPQTARYRVARLRELLGDDLDDPDTRFELELALRAGD